MAEDISRTTIAVLLVLTIVVSVIGTWTVLEGVGTVGSAKMVKYQTTAQVRVGINTPVEGAEAPAPTPGVAKGKVSIKIL